MFFKNALMCHSLWETTEAAGLCCHRSFVLLGLIATPGWGELRLREERGLVRVSGEAPWLSRMFWPESAGRGGAAASGRLGLHFQVVHLPRRPGGAQSTHVDSQLISFSTGNNGARSSGGKNSSFSLCGFHEAGVGISAGRREAFGM